MLLNIVYSTNPDINPEGEGEEETLAPEDQNLHIRLDTKQRRGKAVTLIEGFSGAKKDLKDLASLLKKKCGVGGSAKEGYILIQGNQREKITEILTKEGYNVQ